MSELYRFIPEDPTIELSVVFQSNLYAYWDDDTFACGPYYGDDEDILDGSVWISGVGYTMPPIHECIMTHVFSEIDRNKSRSYVLIPVP